MHELRRLAYLDALDIECYESRRQLPGAAVSRRRPVAKPRVTKPVDVVAAPPFPPITALTPEPGVASAFSPARSSRAERIEDPLQESTPHARSVPRFSLVTMVAGDWLWLEEAGDMPLTMEQVQLVQSMAHALQRYRGHAKVAEAARPEILRFDWPMHNNRQLDSGDDAARAGVAAFISRRLEQYGSRGIVLLGQSCANRVLPHSMDVLTVCTAGTAEILQTPSLKRQVWQELLPLVRAV